MKLVRFDRSYCEEKILHVAWSLEEGIGGYMGSVAFKLYSKDKHILLFYTALKERGIVVEYCKHKQMKKHENVKRINYEQLKEEL